MKFLVDMNLSPEWCQVLQDHGHQAVHWSTLGPGNAPDEEVLLWARENNAIAFTHDLDFGALLAMTGASGPSVVQLREQNVDPQTIGLQVAAAIQQCTTQLEAGAIVTIDLRRAKARFLPINRS